MFLQIIYIISAILFLVLWMLLGFWYLTIFWHRKGVGKKRKNLPLWWEQIICFPFAYLIAYSGLNPYGGTITRQELEDIKNHKSN